MYPANLKEVDAVKSTIFAPNVGQLQHEGFIGSEKLMAS